MSDYKNKYRRSEKTGILSKEDRLYRCAFKNGREIGYNQGYAEGFDGGYEKGYAEGSSLGYNNGFLSALDPEIIDAARRDSQQGQVSEKILSILQSLSEGQEVSIHIYGERAHEVKLLLKHLGVLSEIGPG